MNVRQSFVFQIIFIYRVRAEPFRSFSLFTFHYSLKKVHSRNCAPFALNLSCGVGCCLEHNVVVAALDDACCGNNGELCILLKVGNIGYTAVAHC